MKRKVKLTIHNSVLMAAGVGSTLGPIPFFDLAAMAKIWEKMVIDIADAHKLDISKNQSRRIVNTVIKAGLTTYAAHRLSKSILHAVPVLGSLKVAALAAVVNGFYTFKFGKVLNKEFKKLKKKKNMDLGEAFEDIAIFILPGPADFDDMIQLIIDVNSHSTLAIPKIYQEVINAFE